MHGDLRTMTSEELLKRIIELERRVAELEQIVAGGFPKEYKP